MPESSVYVVLCRGPETPPSRAGLAAVVSNLLEDSLKDVRSQRPRARWECRLAFVRPVKPLYIYESGITLNESESCDRWSLRQRREETAWEYNGGVTAGNG